MRVGSSDLRGLFPPKGLYDLIISPVFNHCFPVLSEEVLDSSFSYQQSLYAVLMLLDKKHRESPLSIRWSVNLNTVHIFALIPLHTLICSQLENIRSIYPMILQTASHLDWS